MALIDSGGNRIAPRTTSSTSTPVTTSEPPVAKNTATGYSSQDKFVANASVPASGGSETPATEKQPLKPSSMQAADRDYDKYKNSGAATTELFIQLMQRHKDDPDYLAELVNRAKQPPGDSVLDYMMGPLTGAFMKDSGGSYAAFSDQDRQTIVDTLNVAKSKGYLSDQEVHDGATRLPGWKDVADRMGIDATRITPDQQTAVDQVNQAKDAYDKAHKEVKELDETLQKELARFGPGLTGEQRAKYTAKFKALHAEAYEKDAKAAEALNQAIETNRPALEAAAKNDPTARGQIYDALKDCASSASPKAAVEFSGDLAQNAQLRSAFADHPDFEKDIIQPSVSGAAGELLAENGGDPQAAYQQLQQLIQPLKDAWDNYGKPGYELFKSTPSEVKEAWDAIGEAAEGKYDKLDELASSWKDAEGVGGFAKALGSAAFTLGGAALKAKNGVSEFQQGEYAKAVSDIAGAGQTGLEVAAGATKALADAGKLAEYTDKALSFADFASKLAPGLGLIANSASFVDHLQEAGKDGGNVGFAVSALGDAIGVMGSAVELIPGAEPVGALFGAVGAGVSALGELIGNAIDEGKLKDEERTCLGAAGIDSGMADKFVDADPEVVDQLGNKLGLSGDQVQQLMQQYPDILNDSGRGLVFERFVTMCKQMGLNGDQTFGLLQSIGQGTGNDMAALEVFTSRLQREYSPPSDGAGWRQLIHTIATDPQNADSLHLTYGNADRYLQGT